MLTRVPGSGSEQLSGSGFLVRGQARAFRAVSALPQVPARGAGSAQPGTPDLLGAGGAAAAQRGGLSGTGAAGALQRLPARAGWLPET